MAVPRLPCRAVRLEPQAIPWDRFDDTFWNTVAEGPVQNGYFAVAGPDEAGYLFVVNGTPYAAGRFEGNHYRFAELKEFFEFYRRHPEFTLSACETDKGLTLGLLTMFQKSPTQQFSTDLVDMQEAMNSVTAKGANAVITHRTADRVGVSLYMKGRLQVNYFCEEPADIPREGDPLDSLVVYVYGKKEEGSVTVGIFEEPKVAAAPDAALVKAAERPRLTQLFAAQRASPAGPKPELVLTLGGKTLGKFPMVVDQFTIGRAPGNDILIDNLGVSRRHAVVKVVDGRYLLEDLGSANGTFVNGERLAGPRELQDGDQIAIVKHTLLFQVPREAGTAPTAPVETAAEQTLYMGPAAAARPAPPAPQADLPAAPALPAAPPPPAPAAPTARPAGAAKLVLPDLSEVSLTKPTTTFGSGFEADIRADGFMIAKVHARIDKDKEGRCRFVRMGRLGATKINDQSVETKPLRNGDVIEIGKSKFIFRVE
ncbi:MAG TPA: FHA domain-containing protein [Candidatus Methylomirabilis sp.]|jgi:pSer/pThr/pTyr-binding forkhead associated (FHA) protein